MLHQSANQTENKWKVTLVKEPETPKNNLPVLIDEYNLCNLLGYNGKYPWFVVHNTHECYTKFWIDKDTKRIVNEFSEDLNLREIAAPAAALKNLQGRLSALIFNKLPKHDANYAYMTGRNVRHAAEAQGENDVLIRIDMKDFFGHHFEPYVRAKLHELTGYSKELCWFITKLCSLEGSLPQGAVTSPVLSVVLNKDMDDRISEIAAEHNFIYTRYADDLCFSGVDRDDTFIRSFIDEVALSVHPFRVNWKKVDIMRNKSRSYVCGVEAKNFRTDVPQTEIPGFKTKVTATKLTVSRSTPMSDEELQELSRTVMGIYGNDVIEVRPKKFYMQSIKRMLGMHLTGGIHYPRDKYSKMRVEAMLVGKGANINVARFRGRLAFMRMVDPAKASKIDAILAKYRRDS